MKGKGKTVKDEKGREEIGKRRKGNTINNRKLTKKQLAN